MGNETTIPASGADPSKLNTYGMTEQQLEKYNETQEEAVKALEQRYLQPNLFKVAAGFLKPQLGGFGASLGSASEALGENLEQRRAAMLPVAQMRAQLAQSQMLLGSKKKASEIAEKSQGRELTQKELEEMSNYDPERAQRYIQAQEARAKTVANNFAMSRHNAEAQGLPQPVLNEMGLPEISLNKQNIDEPVDVDNSLPTSPTTVSTKLPNGARVNSGQEKLAALGVPIISGLRTQEEQDALKDHKDANGHWVTSKGLPVADVSHHTSGNAIDVDVNSLTPEHIGMLKAMGYSQPIPKTDPGHWVLTSGTKQPEEKVRVGGVNMPQSKVQEMMAQEAKAREEPYAAQMNDIVAQATNRRGHSFNDQAQNLTTMNMLYNGIEYKKDAQGKVIRDADGNPEKVFNKDLSIAPAFDALRSNSLKGAILNSISEGLRAHTPWGEIAVNGPVKTFMTSMTMTRKAQERFIEFMRRLSEDRLLQSNISSLRNEKEFNTAMRSITPESFDPGSNVNAYIAKRLSNVEYGQKTHNEYHKWRQKNNMDPNVSNFWNSEEHQKLEDQRKRNIGRADEVLFE